MLVPGIIVLSHLACMNGIKKWNSIAFLSQYTFLDILDLIQLAVSEIIRKWKNKYKHDLVQTCAENQSSEFFDLHI